jgi:hypothetical protein
MEGRQRTLTSSKFYLRSISKILYFIRGMGLLAEEDGDAQ